jgi:CMP-N-acetylneuraminic acid synthetase
MKILAIIPARSGSKGIPNKNIIDVCGKPLIQYSIESALSLKAKGLIEKVIISTDSDKIAQISLKLGAEVPFLRPKEISGDKSKSIDLITHAIKSFEEINEFYDAILLLQPTSPMRKLKHLEKSIELLKNNLELDSLISCYKEEYINDLVMYNSDNKNINKLKPLNQNHNKGVRRQDHGDVYVRNGAIYLTKVDYLKESNQIISDFPLLIEMKKTESINVDSIEDLEFLKKLICK